MSISVVVFILDILTFILGLGYILFQRKELPDEDIEDYDEV